MISKLFTTLLLASAACSLELLPRQACNRDNCYRAVAGTRVGVPFTNSADCSSFFSITATVCSSGAAVVTSTTTSTSTTTITFNPPVSNAPVRPDLARRQNSVCAPTTVRPTSVPSYASACSGTARYSSACSCLIGASKLTTSTTTVAGQASTTVSTVHATFTQGYAADQFLIRVDADDGQLNGYYAIQYSDIVHAEYQIASSFGIDEQGRLRSLDAGNTESFAPVYVVPTSGQNYALLEANERPPSNAVFVYCTLANGYTQPGELSCTAQVGAASYNRFVLIGDQGSKLFLTTSPPAGSMPVRLVRI